MASLTLPTTKGGTEAYSLGPPREFPCTATSDLPRVAFAAAHVVADPLAEGDPWLHEAVDWDATIAYRRHLWGLGLGVAEAMDTAQRGMGLGWTTAHELIRRSVEASRDFDGAALVASGAGTDHLTPNPSLTIDDVIRAYEQQFDMIEKAGGRIILMASRALAACAKSPDDYIRVYEHLLDQAKEPVIIHWLGEMFDPALAGYWGHNDHMAAMDVAIHIITQKASKVDGVKISLLDDTKEITMRRRLTTGVRMYSGDDLNYPDLIAGDEEGHSDALLGIFDSIAPAASAALSAMARQDMRTYHEILAPTVPLSRHIFKAPTRFYKSGVVFMAYLTGHQNHFAMLGGQQSARSAIHLAEIVRLADKAGLLADPEMAASRASTVMAQYGIN